MKVIATNIKAMSDYKGTVEITITVPGKPLEHRADIEKLQALTAGGKTLDVEIKPHRGKRSLDANSFLWILAQKIAEAIGTTKEDVYRKNIREVGQFVIVPIRKDAVERWGEVWNGKGLGWFCEIVGDSKIAGYVNIISYYGSSVYNTKEMSRLIDAIVQECKELGIETLSEAELAALKGEWGNEKHHTG